MSLCVGNARVTSRPGCYSLTDSHASPGFSAQRKLQRLRSPPSALNLILRLPTEEELEEGKGARKSFAKPVLSGCALSRTSTDESVAATWRKFNRKLKWRRKIWFLVSLQQVKRQFSQIQNIRWSQGWLKIILSKKTS